MSTDILTRVRSRRTRERERGGAVGRGWWEKKEKDKDEELMRRRRKKMKRDHRAEVNWRGKWWYSTEASALLNKIANILSLFKTIWQKHDVRAIQDREGHTQRALSNRGRRHRELYLTENDTEFYQTEEDRHGQLYLTEKDMEISI